MNCSKRIAKCILISSVVLAFQSCSSNNKVPEKSAEEKKFELYYNHGTGALMKNNYTKALDLLLQAYRMKQNDPKVLNNLGMAYYFKGQIGLAVKNLSKALELEPKNSDARTNLGGIYFQKGQNKEAEKQYQIVLKDLVYPHQYRTNYNLALISLKRGNRPTAIEYLNKSIQERGDYCPSRHQLGILYRQEARFSSALKHLEEASSGACFKNPQSVYELAKTYMITGDYNRAKVKYELLLGHYPKSEFAENVKIELEKALEALEQREKTKKAMIPKKTKAANVYETPNL